MISVDKCELMARTYKMICDMRSETNFYHWSAFLDGLMPRYIDFISSVLLNKSYSGYGYYDSNVYEIDYSINGVVSIMITKDGRKKRLRLDKTKFKDYK